MIGFTALTLVALFPLLWFTRRGWKAGVWVVKPLASLGFIGAAVAAGALDSDYGRAVLVGLGFGLGGDVLLIPADRRAFLAGLASFLLNHVAYVVAFLGRGVSWTCLGVALVVVAAVLAPVAWWLWPRLTGAMRLAVPAYILTIGLMMASAVACTAPTFTPPAIWLGAGLFLVSDLFVARQRFVAPGFVNRLFGLPLYYVGQLLLASTVGQ